MSCFSFCRPDDRNADDVSQIFSELQSLDVFQSFSPELQRELAKWGHYDVLEKGIIVYQQDQLGSSFYIIIAGTVDVLVSPSGSKEV